MGKDLRAADRWLRIGKPERAAAEYAEAAGRVAASEAAQPDFAARVVRDLDMVRRWSERAAAIG